MLHQVSFYLSIFKEQVGDAWLLYLNLSFTAPQSPGSALTLIILIALSAQLELIQCGMRGVLMNVLFHKVNTHLL